MVSNDVVVGIREPDTSWCLVCYQDTVGSSDLHDEIVVHVVVRLNAVLNEHIVSHAVVDNIPLDGQVLNTVDCCGAVERLMDCVAADVGLRDLTNHVEVDWVSTDLEGLADIEEFGVLDTANYGLVTW